jgi:hypothetical protein
MTNSTISMRAESQKRVQTRRKQKFITQKLKNKKEQNLYGESWLEGFQY